MAKTSWVLKPKGKEEVIEKLSRELNINPILTGLLVQRGITSFDEAKAFFRPSLDMLHDPFLMKDMDQAVRRIDRAIMENEKVLVYGDYDVDGTSAVALVYRFLSKIHSRLEFYIPDRYAEGYGISRQGIDYAHQQGITLIIALDCGIKAADKVEYATSKGIDFIVCDHHLPDDTLPKAVAVLDPKRRDCEYPFKELPGCGIGFKLVQAIAQQRRIPFSEVEELVDLAAIAIGADIVPITGENRVLAWFGMKRINESPRPGIKAILELAGVNKKLSINDVVFIIAPRINAAGRIKSGKQAVELMITDSPDAAKLQGSGIDVHNSTRKKLDESITEEALEMIGRDASTSSRKSILLYNPEWHKGVIGIVASRIADRYHRPTIILTRSGDIACGSARSVKGFDVYRAIEMCEDVLNQFGGHMYAAGMTLSPERVDAFRNRFEEAVCETIGAESLTRQIEIDAEIRFEDITDNFYNVLRQFEPFGPGNQSPVFRTDKVRETGYARIVGKNHLKVALYEPGRQRRLNGIAFRMGEAYDDIKHGPNFDVCYHIEENTFRDRTSLQLNIQDIKVKSKNPEPKTKTLPGQ